MKVDDLTFNGPWLASVTEKEAADQLLHSEGLLQAWRQKTEPERKEALKGAHELAVKKYGPKPAAPKDDAKGDKPAGTTGAKKD